MKNILHVMSSPKTETSASRKLGKFVLQKLRDTYPDSTVTEYDLVRDLISHLREDHIEAFFATEDSKTDLHRLYLDYSDRAIEDLQKADVILMCFCQNDRRYKGGLETV